LAYSHLGPSGRFCLAAGLLTAAVTGPKANGVEPSKTALEESGSWPGEGVLGGVSEDLLDSVWINARLVNDALAWRGLWRAYLRYVTVKMHEIPLDEEDAKPAAPTEQYGEEYLVRTWNFKPFGAEVSDDGQWFFATGFSKDEKETPRWIRYFVKRTGLPAFDITLDFDDGTCRDLIRRPETETVLGICGGFDLSATLEVDMVRGAVTRFFDYPFHARYAVPLPADQWLLVGTIHRVILDAATGVIKDSLPSVQPSVHRGSVGWSEDKRYVLFPYETRHGVEHRWARFDRIELKFLDVLASGDIFQGAQPLLSEMPVSTFPHSRVEWYVTKNRRLAFSEGPLLQHVRLYRTSVSTGGGLTIKGRKFEGAGGTSGGFRIRIR